MNLFKYLSENPKMFSNECSLYHNVDCTDILLNSFKEAVKKWELLSDKTWGAIHA